MRNPNKLVCVEQTEEVTDDIDLRVGIHEIWCKSDLAFGMIKYSIDKHGYIEVEDPHGDVIKLTYYKEARDEKSE